MYIYFQGSTQPELSSLDCAPGSHSIEINRDKADVFVTEELCQKENSSEQLDSSHKVSTEKQVYIIDQITVTKCFLLFQLRTICISMMYLET